MLSGSGGAVFDVNTLVLSKCTSTIAYPSIEDIQHHGDKGGTLFSVSDPHIDYFDCRVASLGEDVRGTLSLSFRFILTSAV